MSLRFKEQVIVFFSVDGYSTTVHAAHDAEAE